MKVLVTGATGFIGGRIAADLLASGTHEVVITGRKPAPGHALVRAGARFLAGDFSDEAFARQAAAGVDAVVHCAGKAGTWGDYAEYHRANVLATRNLLTAARGAGARRFVNLSSPSIYFQFRDQYNLKEADLPPRFSNHYARTKFEAEELVRLEHAPGFATVSLRPRSVIGAGDTNVLPRLLRLQSSGKLRQIGRGENIVDVTTVGNVVDAVGLCLTGTPDALGETYNVTNGSPLRFWSFVELVLSEMGASLERRKVPYSVAMAMARMNEWVARRRGVTQEPELLPISVGVVAHSMTLSIERARARLGYVPRWTNEDGVREFAAWWKQRGEVPMDG